MDICSLDKMDEAFIFNDESGLITKSLGLAAGSQRIYVNIDRIAPGAVSTKYHSHSQQEEFFLVLDGAGTLRMNDMEYQVKKGDFVAKLPAQNIAHQFLNSGKDILVILDAGTVEKEDTCYYPDENVSLFKSNGRRLAFEDQSVLDGWTSDPNTK